MEYLQNDSYAKLVNKVAYVFFSANGIGKKLNQKSNFRLLSISFVAKFNHPQLQFTSLKLLHDIFQLDFNVLQMFC